MTWSSPRLMPTPFAPLKCSVPPWHAWPYRIVERLATLRLSPREPANVVAGLTTWRRLATDGSYHPFQPPAYRGARALQHRHRGYREQTPVRRGPVRPAMRPVAGTQPAGPKRAFDTELYSVS